MSTDQTTRDEAREAIRTVLLAWEAGGVDHPIIPVYADEDGDGIADFYGLDDGGDLVLVSGATVEDTVSVSTGEDGF